MLTAAYAAFEGADTATGGAVSSWISGVFGGGASSDAEKAARALDGQHIAPGPYTVEAVRAALQAGGNSAFLTLKRAVELKDFMRPGRNTWPGPWTPDLLANAAVYFAHGAIDGKVTKNETKIRDAVAQLVTRYGSGAGTTSSSPYTQPSEAPYGGSFDTSGVTDSAETPNYGIPAEASFFPTSLQELQDSPTYLWALLAVLLVAGVVVWQGR